MKRIITLSLLALVLAGAGYFTYAKLTAPNPILISGSELAKEQEFAKSLYYFNHQVIQATDLAESVEHRVSVANWNKLAKNQRKTLTTWLKTHAAYNKDFGLYPQTFLIPPKEIRDAKRRKALPLIHQVLFVLAQKRQQIATYDMSASKTLQDVSTATQNQAALVSAEMKKLIF